MATRQIKMRILDQRRAEYPTEHNVGHLYYAKPSLVNHYRSLDPSNSLNPPHMPEASSTAAINAQFANVPEMAGSDAA